MKRQSLIVKLGLESKAREMSRDPNNSLTDVAEALSKICKQKITKIMVFKFLKADNVIISETLATKAELAAKITEVEINSIDDWLEDIKFLSDLAADAWSAGDYRAASLAMKIKIESREGVNKQLGRLNNNPNVTINNINVQKNSNPNDYTDEQLTMIINGELNRLIATRARTS